MSNLIKSSYISYNPQEQRKIDVHLRNDFFKVSKPKLIENEKFDGGFNEGIPSMNIEKSKLEQESQMEERARQIIDEANKKAADIIEAARLEATQVKQEAMKVGEEEGFKQGLDRGQEEAALIKEQLKETALLQEKEYETLLTDLEPKFVGIMISLIEKITGVVVEDKKEVILHLVNQAMNNLENNRNFVIRVSKEDYSYLLDNRQNICAAANDAIQIEIIEDMSLEKNQCLIETDTRIIDCSLDVQLDNLIGDLKLLANL